MERYSLPLGYIGRGLALGILCWLPAAASPAAPADSPVVASDGTAVLTPDTSPAPIIVSPPDAAGGLSTTTPSTTAPALAGTGVTPSGALAPDEQSEWSDIQAAITGGKYKRAEQLLNDWLNTHPDDKQAHYLRGYVLMFEENIPLSVGEFDLLLRDDPNNPNYLLGKAKALVRGQRDAEAIPILDQLRAQTPNVPLVYQLELESLGRMNNPNQLAAIRAEAAQKFPNMNWNPAAAPVRQVVSTRHPVVLSGGATYDFLNHGYSNWRTYYVGFNKTDGPHKSLYGSVLQTHRFDQDDTLLALGDLFPIDENWFGRVEATGSPTHHVLERYSVLGELGRSIGNGITISGGARHLDYTSQGTNVQFVSLSKLFGRIFAGYTLGFNEANGTSAVLNHSVQLYDYYGGANVIGIGATVGKTTVNVGSPNGAPQTLRVVTADVLDVDLNGTHWLLPEWGVDYGIGWHKLGDFFTRKSVTLGLRHPINF